MNCTFTRRAVFCLSLLFAIAMPQPAAAQAGGLSTTANWAAEGDQSFEFFGWSVASAGDVNGDGFSDVIVGAHEYSNGQDKEGAAFVYHGPLSGVGTTPNWTAEGNQYHASFGHSVASAGDVNGDGYSDVIVSAPFHNNGQLDEGRAYVYHGSASGLSLTPAWTAESNQAWATLGASVASAGDVNGDGYSDVIVGSDYYSNGQNKEGRAFVYYGSASGLNVTDDWTAESNQAGAYFGYSVASAGDVNGDGYSDIIVGAYGYDNGQEDEGRAFVYHGSASGLSATADWTAESNKADAIFGYCVASAGDVNGDGYSDVIVGAPNYDNGQSNEGRAFFYYGSASGLSATPTWTAESNQVDARFGVSVASAGDVNGDGYSDVIVGAWEYLIRQANDGAAFVYYGSASGLSPTAGWTTGGYRAHAHHGGSVASAGDVNGDGCGDVIVGACCLNTSAPGRAYVYHGAPSPPRASVRIPWTLFE